MRRMCVLVLASILGACAGTGGGLNSMSKTNALLPGMSVAEVKALLGPPTSTQFVGERLVWKYALHEYWKGWVPYYLVFAEEPPALARWYADEVEYQRQQALWLRALPQGTQTAPPAAGAAAPARSAGQGNSAPGKAALEACKAKYRDSQDRMCHCYLAC